MSKTVLSLIGATILVCLGIFSVRQNGTIKTQGHTIVEQKHEIVALEESLDITIEEKHALLEENTVLKERITVLRDSVKTLTRRVRTLAGDAKKQKKTIKALQAKVKQYQADYDQLKNQLASLQNQPYDDQLVATLEAEKAQLQKQLQMMSTDMMGKVEAYKMTKAELMDMQTSKAEMARIAAITDNTKVVFQHVSARKTRFGKPLKKVKKEGKNWKYTIVEFFLEHPDRKMLLDEQFMIRIINKATGEAISHIEPNPAFPESYMDSKGVEFTYSGDLVEIAFRNNEKKVAADYDVQISYVKNGEEYMLNNGTKPIIVRGSSVKFKK
ncbi:MAG: hypothetical protein AAFO94_09955 [Bacteroidota bacterium]